MAKQSKAQKDIVDRIMHEFKQGELETSAGIKVESRRQAIAIGLSEAGASNQQTPAQNNKRRRKTVAGARDGNRARQSEGAKEPSKAELYEKAKRQDVAGRSKMSKAQLARAVE